MQLSEVNFEMAHQRVQLQGKVAETESRAALTKETMQEKVSGGHVTVATVQVLLYKFM